MTTYYWTIDLYDSDNQLIKEGNIKYATEFQASMEARGMSEIPHEIIIKVQKHKFDF